MAKAVHPFAELEVGDILEKVTHPTLELPGRWQVHELTPAIKRPYRRAGICLYRVDKKGFYVGSEVMGYVKVVDAVGD